MLELRQVANLKTGVAEIGWKWIITDVLTEGNTDILIELVDKIPIPWYARIARGFIKKKLDDKLPEILIDLLVKVLLSRHILTQDQINRIKPGWPSELTTENGG